MMNFLKTAVGNVSRAFEGRSLQGALSAGARWAGKNSSVINTTIHYGAATLGAYNAQADVRQGRYGKAALWGAIAGAGAVGVNTKYNTIGNVVSAARNGRAWAMKNAGTFFGGAERAAAKVGSRIAQPRAGKAGSHYNPIMKSDFMIFGPNHRFRR